MMYIDGLVLVRNLNVIILNKMVNCFKKIKISFADKDFFDFTLYFNKCITTEKGNSVSERLE